MLAYVCSCGRPVHYGYAHTCCGAITYTLLAPGGSPTPAGDSQRRTDDTAAVSEAGAETLQVAAPGKRYDPDLSGASAEGNDAVPGAACSCPPGWKHRPDCHHVTG